ncbi:hypothetical protein [Natrialbaceae archaeon AArc-T1-2]|uniref:hypothetical protein n=1 Tax=Natrialbaceae archaeon AArc-T1-2 TaxID=3053904 RepID=UPI00255AA805|nr:hypothetical protein [Natrialbaceae archaeon AArc-T1-2]WIV66077.1 hypothetical protein QQ977_10265 [Natrialbaceae archaeon AArc-T1-2]
MTAREMQIEQDYHSDRIETLARSVLGSGIVVGLQTTVKREQHPASNEEILRVEVSEGYALNPAGQPVLVEDPEIETFPLNEVGGTPSSGNNDVSVYLRPDPCLKEKVPIPGAADTRGDDCTYNHVIEDVKIEVKPGAPDHEETVGEVKYPDATNLEPGAGSETPLLDIAHSYAPGDDQSAVGTDAGHVFLGHFLETDQGETWRMDDSHPPRRVYTNDLLYAAIARHAADFENPHNTVATVAGVEPDTDGDVAIESPNESATVSPDPDDNTIRIEVSSGDHSGDIDEEVVRTINFINPDEGDITIQSEDGTVTIDPRPAENTIDLSVGDLVRELEDREQRIQELEERIEKLERLTGDVEDAMNVISSRSEIDTDDLKLEFDNMFE